MGGSIHDWKRGSNPFDAASLPDHVKEAVKGEPWAQPMEGWLALDAVGNEIGFLPDGTVIPTITDERKSINWTRPMLDRFKKEYEKHAKDVQGSFMFDGNEYVVGYAKYLIEYLESKL